MPVLSRWRQLPAVLLEPSPLPLSAHKSAEHEKIRRLAHYRTEEAYTKTFSWPVDC